MPDTLIDLIRHGEPVGGRRYRGNGADDPLSDLGWRQMDAALAAATPWDQVISSPLARCREFAMALASARGLPLAIDPGFIEIGMGAWEGRPHAEVAAADPAAYAAFQRDPVGIRPPGGERLEPFGARIAAAYQRQLRAYPGRHLLLVCHAGVSRALIGHVLQAAPERWYRIRIDYAGLTRIREGRWGPVLELVNGARLPADG